MAREQRPAEIAPPPALPGAGLPAAAAGCADAAAAGAMLPINGPLLSTAIECGLHGHDLPATSGGSAARKDPSAHILCGMREYLRTTL